MKLDLQLFGGRGGSSGLAGGGVDYDSWGEMWHGYDHPIYDKDGRWIGEFEDDIEAKREPYSEPLTKKGALEVVNSWRNDDGTYGDDDVAISIAYEDGSFVNANELDGKAIKKRGISGIYVMTPEEEYAWGGEYHKGKFTPYETHEYDASGNMKEHGNTNSMSSYKWTEQRKVRKKITYNQTYSDGSQRKKIEIVKASKWKRS